jgi:hypothetical protein
MKDTLSADCIIFLSVGLPFRTNTGGKRPTMLIHRQESRSASTTASNAASRAFLETGTADTTQTKCTGGHWTGRCLREERADRSQSDASCCLKTAHFREIPANFQKPSDYKTPASIWQHWQQVEARSEILWGCCALMTSEHPKSIAVSLFPSCRHPMFSASFNPEAP